MKAYFAQNKPDYKPHALLKALKAGVASGKLAMHHTKKGSYKVGATAAAKRTRKPAAKKALPPAPKPAAKKAAPPAPKPVAKAKPAPKPTPPKAKAEEKEKRPLLDVLFGPSKTEKVKELPPRAEPAPVAVSADELARREKAEAERLAEVATREQEENAILAALRAQEAEAATKEAAAQFAVEKKEFFEKTKKAAETKAALERAKEEAIDLLKRQAVRRMLNQSLSFGWTAWHEYWAAKTDALQRLRQVIHVDMHAHVHAQDR